MNTLKNTVVVVTLLGVGYGAHVVLSTPGMVDGEDDQQPESWPQAMVQMEEAEALRPDVSLHGLPQEGMSAESLRGEHRASLASASDGGSAQRLQQPNALPGEAQRAAHFLAGSSTSAPQAGISASATTDHDSRGQAGPPPADELSPGQQASPVPAEPVVESEPKTASDFASIRHLVQRRLSRDELPDALLILSLWYRDPAGNEQEKAEVLPLLDQLAGTIIYSRTHWLEPAYTVKPGDTLDQIADQYQVPTQLLGKINGISSPERLVPGEPLKVVPGPFHAEASRSRRELTLYLGQYYAGRFSIRPGRELPAEGVALEVIQKQENRSYVDSQSQREIAAGAPDNPYGRYWMELRPTPGLDLSGLAIHGTGDACAPDDPRGCIGLSPGDAADLYSILSVGSRVEIIP